MNRVKLLHTLAATLLIVAAVLYLAAIAPGMSPLLFILGCIAEVGAVVATYFTQPKEVRRTPGDDSPRLW